MGAYRVKSDEELIRGLLESVRRLEESSRRIREYLRSRGG